MKGYWNNPQASAKSLDREGWLHTGDLAEIRDGRIFIRGRLKDVLVLSNGEKLPRRTWSSPSSGTEYSSKAS